MTEFENCVPVQCFNEFQYSALFQYSEFQYSALSGLKCAEQPAREGVGG